MKFTGKLCSLLMALVMMFSLAACGGNTEDTTKPVETTAAQAEQAEEVKEDLTPYDGDLETPAFEIKINGKAFTEKDFAELDKYTYNSVSVNSAGTETDCWYIGYKIADVAKVAGIEKVTSGTVVCSDGYEVKYTEDQFANKLTMLAFYKDEEPSDEEKTVWLAPCSEKISQNFAKMVVEINFD